MSTQPSSTIALASLQQVQVRSAATAAPFTTLAAPRLRGVG